MEPEDDTSACQADVEGKVHSVDRLNTPLWHAWNPCGCTSTERVLFDENQLNQ